MSYIGFEVQLHGVIGHAEQLKVRLEVAIRREFQECDHASDIVIDVTEHSSGVSCDCVKEHPEAT